MKTTGLTLALTLAAAAPVAASGGLSCAGGEAQIDLVLGRMQVLAVADARIAIGPDLWVTAPHLGEGTPITIGQAFGEGRQISVDLTDEIVNDIVARLRLFTADNGDQPVIGGILEMPDLGAWVVSCEETG